MMLIFDHQILALRLRLLESLVHTSHERDKPLVDNDIPRSVYGRNVHD